MEGKGGKKENIMYQSGSGRAYRSNPNPFRQTATIQVMWSVLMQKHENVSMSFSFFNDKLAHLSCAHYSSHLV